MKKTSLVLAILTTVFMSCSTQQKATVTTNASGVKVIDGPMTRQTLEGDTAFPWFAANQKFGTADAAAVQTFEQKKDQFKMLVFGGTWCPDTQNLLPVFYRLVGKSGYPEEQIQLVGVNEQKQDKQGLYKKWGITNVPTFIVLDNNGLEKGRVVEYGTLNAVDKELGEIIRKAGL